MKFTSLFTAAAAIALTSGAALAQGAAVTPPASDVAKPPAQAAAPTQPGAAAGATTSSAATARPVVAKGDIIQTAQASGQFTTFLKAVDATNLTSVLKGNQNLTVFAPTDAAFAALPPGELDRLMADKAALQKLLTHHVINARVESSKIKGARGEVTTVAGDKILLDGSGDTMVAGNADIIQADVAATNGLLYVVDAVIRPGAAAVSGAPASATAPQAPEASTAPVNPSQAPTSGAPAQKGN